MTCDEFLANYQRLRQALPRAPTYSLDNESCDSSGYIYHCRNCSFCFDCAYCKHCLYSFDAARIVDCIDTDYCVDSEMLYECVDCYKTYNGMYLNYCARLYDSAFCYDCMDSHDLFGCTHLKQKQYCVFNKEYSKEAYQAEVAKLTKNPPEEHLKKLEETIARYPLGPTNVTHSENCDYGNHVHYSVNCYLCFDAARNENCGYLYDSFYSKNSYDLTQCAHVELCYECRDSSRCFHCDHVDWSSNCYDSSFLTNCTDCHNCFGCVGLTHKKYCILNKQYKKEAYEKEIEEIRQSAHEIQAVQLAAS